LNSLRSLVTGIGNVGLGYAALYNDVAGHYNVGVGYQPLFYYTNGSSIGIGYQAGISVHGGTGNVFLGNAADGGAWYLENAMALGWEATVTNSNEVVLGNPSVTRTVLRGNIIGPSNAVFTGNLTALGTSNNLGGVVLTNGGVHVPGDASISGATTAATLQVTNLVYQGVNFSPWAGPTNSLTLGPAEFGGLRWYHTITNNCAVTNVAGVTNGNVWLGYLTLTNGTSSNVTFSVEIAGHRGFGGMTNRVVTVLSTNVLSVGIAATTNGVNMTSVAAGLSNY
jgi:hypothetical protein